MNIERMHTLRMQLFAWMHANIEATDDADTVVVGLLSAVTRAAVLAGVSSGQWRKLAAAAWVTTQNEVRREQETERKRAQATERLHGIIETRLASERAEESKPLVTPD